LPIVHIDVDGARWRCGPGEDVHVLEPGCGVVGWREVIVRRAEVAEPLIPGAADRFVERFEVSHGVIV
jgi:hypothetical protein